MNWLLTSLLFACLVSPWMEASDQGTPIWDGENLKGWSGNTELWRIEDGAIVGEIPAGGRLGKNEFLYFDRVLQDFELHLEYKIEGPTANSGVQVRSAKDGDGHAVGYQADLDDGQTWLGRIYDEHGRGLVAERGALTMVGPDGKREVLAFAPPDSFRHVPRPADWNHYRIRCRGARIDTFVNGVRFASLEDRQDGEADAQGQIALQLHSGAGPARVSFRNIRLVEMPPLARDGDGKAPKADVGIVPTDAPNIGFEQGNLNGWKSTGDMAEGSPVRTGAVKARNRGKSLADGKFWYGGYEFTKSDAPTGRLESNPFEITHPWGAFLAGGGDGKNTRVELVLTASGEIVASEAGGHEREEMERVAVDLTKWIGQKMCIRLIDQSEGHWGHINYDDFRFYERSPVGRDPRASRLDSPLLRHLQPNPNDRAAGSAERFVPPGFAIDVVASEPRVRQPIAFTFDDRGRIWVAEAFAYPRRRPEGAGMDRLVILEDADGDGTFESRKVFIDHLNLVSGFELGYGGVFVGAAPEFLFIPDADGDDVPDGPVEVLLNGFSIRDTHETQNSFLWGYDGWLYGTHGVFNHSKVGPPGTPQEKRVHLRAGVWRFHPILRTFEVYAHGGSNPWGLDFNRHGDLFMTHCRSAWGRGPVSQVFRDGHYWNQNNSNHAPRLSTGKGGYKLADIPLFSPLQSIAAYGHGEGGAGTSGSKAIFGGHAHVGALIYQGNNWPAEYRGQLYTHNLHGHQMNREILEPFDSGYRSSSHGRDMFHDSSPTYLGVDLKTGPDGAVYIIDWADKQQCHSNKEEIWDRSNGNLLRFAWTETYEPVQVALDKADPTAWVALLGHENNWHVRMAIHLLRQAGDKVPAGIAERLRAKLADASDPNRLFILYALDAVNGLNDATIKGLLSDADEHVRHATFQLLTDRDPSRASAFAKQILRMAEKDPSAKVRLGLAGAAQHRLPEGIALEVLERLALRAEDASDRFIPKMLWFAAARHWDTHRDRLAPLAVRTPLPTLRQSILWQLAQEDPNACLEILAATPEGSGQAKDLAVIRYGLENTKIETPPPAWSQVMARYASSADVELQREIAALEQRLSGKLAAAPKAPAPTQSGTPAEGARALLVEAVPGLLYRQTRLEVSAGEPLVLRFSNTDAIPHNLIFVAPGAFKKVGEASLAMLSDPEAANKSYAPDLPEVLQVVPIINAGETHLHHFRAPTKPGEYPYLCTFPGHWQVMKGVMVVGEAKPAGTGATGAKEVPPTAVSFEKRQLSDKYYSEGASIADLNNDGHPDVIAGPLWWEGPTFERSHAYAPVKAFPSDRGYANNFFTFPDELTQDEWTDVIGVGLPASAAKVAINPGAKPFPPDNTKHTCEHCVAQEGTCNESPQYVDVIGDEAPEILAYHNQHITLAVPNADPKAIWTVFNLTPRDGRFAKYEHGLGAGDVNGDGRMDILEKTGWWEQPVDWDRKSPWTYHAHNFVSNRRGGAQMFAIDVNGDGLNDVVTAHDGHGYGLSWHEQVREDNEIGFKQHMVMTDKPAGNPYGVCFSQLHAMDCVDIDGDGIKDFVTGKCYNAHNGKDPGAKDPAVLYWFKTRRHPDGSAELIPYKIDDDSGVGRQISTGDLNRDGRPDIVVGNKKGVFAFIQK